MKFFLSLLSVALLLIAARCNAQSTEPGHIRGVTAITEIFGDGQKISAVAVEYDRVIDTSKLEASDFSVAGKTVTKVYANRSAAKAARGINGSYVIIELSTAIVPDPGFGPRPSPSNNAPPSPDPDSRQGAYPPSGGGPKLGEVATDSPISQPLTVQIIQSGNLTCTDGQIYPAEAKVMTNSKNINLMLDGFRQHVYQNPNHPDSPLMYNLFIPKNYDPSKKYPLVLFIHDAGVVSRNPTKTLTQGLGAVIWATPAEQAKHECFVLAPQYDSVIVDDTCQPSESMDITVDLIRALVKQFSIDTNRLYNTGQSMGGMISIAMDIKYPDLFAASFLVACQWDVSKVAPLAKKNLWIIVSQGDNKASPGMDAITESLKQQGATVSKATWLAESSASDFARNVSSMLAVGGNINYTIFKNGNHRYTWQYAYTIEGVRDWLFAQTK